MQDESRLSDEIIKYAMSSANGDLLSVYDDTLNWTGDDCLNTYDIKSEHRIIFSSDNGDVIGELNWITGELKFTGDIKNSARVFFNCLKVYIDKYIKEDIKDGRRGNCI